MYIHGSFINTSGDRIEVHILTRGDRSKELEIGSEESVLSFTADNPVEISGETNDTFDVLLRRSAAVRLLCRTYLPDLFCRSAREAVVSIYRGDRLLFGGYIEPLAYSQSFAEAEDELELSCIDVLSSLQYSNYRGIGSGGVSYTSVKSSASLRSFLDIIKECVLDAAAGIDIRDGGKPSLLYDGSKLLTVTDGGLSVLDKLTVSERLFLGGEEDDTWTEDTVVGELLKYLDLHILQEGLKFYVFSWPTVSRSPASASGAGQTEWSVYGSDAVTTMRREEHEISLSNVYGTDANISIGDVYNRIVLKCDIASDDTAVESPLSSDSLIGVYGRSQRYCIEFSAKASDQGLKDIYSAVHDHATKGDSYRNEWYIRLKRNPGWKFPDHETGGELYAEKCRTEYDQNELPDWLGSHTGACLLSMGKRRVETNRSDNSPSDKPELTDMLVVSVNGNGDDTNPFPDSSSLVAASPVAEYTGGSGGGSLSPASDDITNYIVITGRMVLNPLMETSAPFSTMYLLDSPLPFLNPAEYFSAEARYYTRTYFYRYASYSFPGSLEPITTPPFYDGMTMFHNNGEDPFNPPTGGFVPTEVKGLVPYSGEASGQYKFQYSAIGDSSDTVSKVAVLACQLIVGDKCVIEEPGGDGAPSSFRWAEFKSREQCADDDEYYLQSFTLGFDPRIGDSLVGQEYDIQDNTDYYKYGIDASGTAIPVKASDRVSGSVTFRILGAVNTVWGNVTRRHKTWFRSAKWSDSSVPLLAHVSNIVVKDLKIEIMSDNGGNEQLTGDNDVVYMSDTDEDFLNVKDDIEMKVSSALTAAECARLGVRSGVNLSTPVRSDTRLGVLSVYDTISGQQAKPEQIYVDAHYTECHEPRLEMELSLRDNGADTPLFFSLFRHPAVGKWMYPISVGHDLMSGTARLRLKETWEKQQSVDNNSSER